MKKIIKDLNRLYKELQPYRESGTFLLGSRTLPSKFIFYGLPPLYINHECNEFKFSVDPNEISDKEFDRLVEELDGDAYQTLVDMQAIVCSHAKRIKQFAELRELFDFIYPLSYKSRKALRIGFFRREIPYDYKLSQSKTSEDLPIEDAVETVESENEKGSACGGVCLSCCGDNQ